MEKYTDIRNRLFEYLKQQMTGPSFDAWVRDLEIVSIDDDLCIAYFGVPEISGRNVSQIVSVLNSRYRELLEAALKSVLQGKYRIVVKLLSEYDNSDQEGSSIVNQFEEKTPAKNAAFGPQYTFDAFVVGAANRLAYAAAIAVAASPGQAYNPVYIYGASGMGKTHLLQAIGAYIREHQPQLSVLYVSAENFTNEFITAIQKKATHEFKAKYRTVDVLLIDDIQFFGRAKESQEEFFHTFNDLYQANKQIVISSDCEPEKLDNLQDRLKTRFQWNLIADIQPPSYETRVAILLKHAELQGLELTQGLYDVIDMIAQSVTRNVRELEGALTRIVNFSKLLNEDISPQFAKKTLKNIFKEEEGKITPEKIKRVVSQFYQVKESDLDSDKRQKNISEARQMAMYLMREYTDLSLPKIGECFGGKHHTTVIHSCNRVEELAKSRQDVKEILKALKSELGV